MNENNINRVHRLAGLMLYDLELSDSVRHPVRFFLLDDIRRAAGLPRAEPLLEPTLVTQLSTEPHHPASESCYCRFCATGLLDTRILKRAP